jgi:hypothetical protein
MDVRTELIWLGKCFSNRLLSGLQSVLGFHEEPRISWLSDCSFWRNSYCIDSVNYYDTALRTSKSRILSSSVKEDFLSFRVTGSCRCTSTDSITPFRLLTVLANKDVLRCTAGCPEVTGLFSAHMLLLHRMHICETQIPRRFCRILRHVLMYVMFAVIYYIFLPEDGAVTNRNTLFL